MRILKTIRILVMMMFVYILINDVGAHDNVEHQQKFHVNDVE